MSDVFYTLNVAGEDQFLSVFMQGVSPDPIHSSHPNFDEVLRGVQSGDTSLDYAGLIDVSAAVAARFESLTRRVSVANGVIYLDGDPVHSAVTDQVVRFMDEGVEDWKPLVQFFEKVQANPCDHSRGQLYAWLSNRRGISISGVGNIVGYKGVERSEDGTLLSIHSGSATVDGRPVKGRIPNSIGSTVEMPRSAVAHDPSAACSSGLHVGTYEYAWGFSRGAMLECHVDPRDVVSVPTDGGGEKVRVCRYLIAGTIDTPYTSALVEVDGEDAGEYDANDYDDEGW